jgi:ATP-dependent Lhr-like helicase
MTMSSPPSSSSVDAIDAARAYDRLHPKVREWIWDQQWQQLRTIQALAIGPILDGGSDVIVSAATAGGKTEAAWLPIASALAFDAEAKRQLSGVKALYLSPLKALINDQYSRLKQLFEYVDLPVYRRHGDVQGTDREAIRTRPDGVLLTTPESLEALFVTQGTRIPAIFNGLRYIVIDELHSFIGVERGAQLQSLLHRLELATRRTIPRIALSATLADPRIAADFLRPGGGESVITIGSNDSDGSGLKLLLRGYISMETFARPDDSDETETIEDSEERQSIAENIFTTMRGKDNLVFANSRSNVEIYTDILRRMCDTQRVPNEFFAHHGNLSKEAREDVEGMLKATDRHATAICTSTLELGIDVGSADTIGQIGAPFSVAALRQRLGRSGRRGNPAILRMYVTEQEITPDTQLVDQLRAETVQTIAVVELLLERWYESPNVNGLHLSTLIQQVLSVIAQHGGATAAQLYSALCSHGPFARVDREMFVQLLRDLGEKKVIEQASDGLLLHGELGEKIVNHYSFYTAFQTTREYRLVAYGKTLGSMPIDFATQIGSLLLFGGRRWKVTAIDDDTSVIEVVRSSGGLPPHFVGTGGEVSTGVRRKMREVLGGETVPAYLSETSQKLLREGRSTYRRFGLDRSMIYGAGGNTILLPWRGDLVMNTLAVVLGSEGVEISRFGIAIECRNASAAYVRTLLKSLAAQTPPNPLWLANTVRLKLQDKYDDFLGPELLNQAYAARSLDVPGAWSALREMVG